MKAKSFDAISPTRSKVSYFMDYKGRVMGCFAGDNRCWNALKRQVEAFSPSELRAIADCLDSKKDAGAK